jgi:6-pyruvoyltetrahydropterin/6-carboxytetrahydropterin synthase
MLYLTRKFTFSAAHKLNSPALSKEGNACTYGICENVHGHNYRLEVTVSGEKDSKTGFFSNVMVLAETVKTLVVDPCDHRLLNDVPLFAGCITTMESLATRIWEVLEPELKKQNMSLSEILFAETDEHWVRLNKKP